MSVGSRFQLSAGEVSYLVDGVSDTVVVLAHGAGGGMTSAFMTAAAAELGRRDLSVCRFNFLYSEEGRRAPDRQPLLEQTYRDVVDHLRRELSPRHLILGGKSMGGRIASQIVAAGYPATGVVYLGYPLHPPGRPDRIRAAHLRDISVPMLFVQGTRDPFCPVPTLEDVRSRLRATTEVSWIDEGDHSFKVPKSSGRTPEQVLAEVAGAVATWVARIASD